MLERPDVGPRSPASPRNARRSRAPLLVALLALAVLAGSGLFAAGFTLGSLHERTPGTSVDDQALFDPYWQAYHKIVSDYVGTFTDKQLVEGSIKGMFQALGDPYSSYLDPQVLEHGGLRFEQAGLQATVTLSRPETKNSQTPATWMALRAIGAMMRRRSSSVYPNMRCCCTAELCWGTSGNCGGRSSRCTSPASVICVYRSSKSRSSGRPRRCTSPASVIFVPSRLRSIS